MVKKIGVIEMDYTKTNAKWVEYGEYFNYPESLESKVRIKTLCFIAVPCSQHI